jgi:hypothetical protein
MRHSKLGFYMAVLSAFLFGMSAVDAAPPSPPKSAFDFTIKRAPSKKPTVSAQAPKPVLSYVIDDFERSGLRAWWHFGSVSMDLYDNGARQLDPAVEGRALRLSGSTKEWVLGGCGRYIGVDIGQFNALKLVVKGESKKAPVSGVMIVELYVTRDNEWRSRSLARREYSLRYESKFSTTVHVNWKGWKVVTIPFDAFLADSPRVKQPFWDKVSKTASGNLIQIQLVALAPQEKGDVDVQVDSIALVNDPNFKRHPDLLDF